MGRGAWGGKKAESDGSDRSDRSVRSRPTLHAPRFGFSPMLCQFTAGPPWICSHCGRDANLQTSRPPVRACTADPPEPRTAEEQAMCAAVCHACAVRRRRLPKVRLHQPAPCTLGIAASSGKLPLGEVGIVVGCQLSVLSEPTTDNRHLNLRLSCFLFVSDFDIRISDF